MRVLDGRAPRWVTWRRAADVLAGADAPRGASKVPSRPCSERTAREPERPGAAGSLAPGSGPLHARRNPAAQLHHRGFGPLPAQTRGEPPAGSLGLRRATVRRRPHWDRGRLPGRGATDPEATGVHVRVNGHRWIEQVSEEGTGVP